jgi:hypothetical protein
LLQLKKKLKEYEEEFEKDEILDLQFYSNALLD